ncbi:MAG: fibronectin type III domain-containing protein [Candidatus Sumerlaeia bacterium]|nr:fibronectin type III domain-containing protein [Candidatus Sumerlaeia bacterium]
MKGKCILAVLVVSLSAQTLWAQPKRVIFIRNTGASDYATADVNIIRAIATSGYVRYEGFGILGLGWTVTEVQERTDQQTYTAADTDLIFVSQTISSGNIEDHSDDPVGVIMTEQALYDDDTGNNWAGRPRSEMSLSDGAAQINPMTHVRIVDNTHPITSIFTSGTTIQLFENRPPNPPPQGGVSVLPLGAGVRRLAALSATDNRFPLVAADTGAALRPRVGTAPARRVNLGYHNNAMDFPTSAGVVLLLRTCQWAAGVTPTVDFSSVQMAAVASATRAFGSPFYQIGDVTTATITIVHRANSNPLIVREVIPSGWTASDISHGGTFNASTGEITWNLNFTGTTVLRYSFLPKANVNTSSQFSGTTTDAAGFVTQIMGTVNLNEFDAKPIIYVKFVSSTPRYDDVARNVLGTVGYTSGSISVKGLGYPIWTLTENDAEEATSFTTNHGVLLFISHSVGTEANIAYHTKDNIPILMTKSGMFNNTAPPMSDMYFCTGTSSAAGAMGFNIVATTHPITSIFPLGFLQLWRGGASAPVIGAGTGTFGSSVIKLAGYPVTPLNPNPTSVTLAVAEAGESGFMTPAAAQPYVSPKRRAILGYQEFTLDNPTANGIYLLQRTAQWLIGDNVTAGANAPAAPTNLTSVQSGISVQLNWQTVANANGYAIQRKVGDTGTYQDIGKVRYNTPTFMDSGVGIGKTYYYRVRAFNVTGESGYSNETSITFQPSLNVQRWEHYR